MASGQRLCLPPPPTVSAPLALPPSLTASPLPGPPPSLLKNLFHSGSFWHPHPAPVSTPLVGQSGEGDGTQAVGGSKNCHDKEPLLRSSRAPPPLGEGWVPPEASWAVASMSPPDVGHPGPLIPFGPPSATPLAVTLVPNCTGIGKDGEGAAAHL